MPWVSLGCSRRNYLAVGGCAGHLSYQNESSGSFEAAGFLQSVPSGNVQLSSQAPQWVIYLMRFLSAQLEAYITNLLRNAAHANKWQQS